MGSTLNKYCIIVLALQDIYCSYVTLHGMALHCITVHCIASHCIIWHCIALHCIALHCIIAPSSLQCDEYFIIYFCYQTDFITLGASSLSYIAFISIIHNAVSLSFILSLPLTLFHPLLLKSFVYIPYMFYRYFSYIYQYCIFISSLRSL